MSADDYIVTFKTAADEIHRLQPEGKVMTGGFATIRYVRTSNSPDFIAKVLAGINGKFDVHAHHEHGSFERFALLIDSQFIPMREKLKITAPWYANETAIHSVAGAEVNQAATLYKKIVVCLEPRRNRL